jgi:hypothetical protein
VGTDAPTDDESAAEQPTWIGTVEEISGPQWTVSGRPISITAGATISGTIEPGQVIRFWGALGADDVFLVRAVELDPGETLVIDSADRVDGDQLLIRGRSTLPDGACLEARLFAQGAPVDWWPELDCVPVEGHTWRISLPLGEDSVPAELDAVYELRVWQPERPQEQAVLWFDLLPSD